MRAWFLQSIILILNNHCPTYINKSRYVNFFKLGKSNFDEFDASAHLGPVVVWHEHGRRYETPTHLACNSWSILVKKAIIIDVIHGWFGC